LTVEIAEAIEARAADMAVAAPGVAGRPLFFSAAWSRWTVLLSARAFAMSDAAGPASLYVVVRTSL
jgi:hypothetical protein